MLLNDIHIKILKFLSENTDSLTLMEIGDAVGLDHAQKVQDKLSQLEREGYISRSEFGRYEVSRLPENDGKVVIPFFGFAQCGNAGAEILETEYPKKKLLIDEKLINPSEKKKYFITRAKGDSMLPFIKPGDFVLIHIQTTFDSPDLVLVLHNHQPKIKKIQKIGTQRFLHSLNSEFNDIELEEFKDDINIIGIVRETFDSDAFSV